MIIGTLTILTALVLVAPRAARTLESFFVHNRNLGWLRGSFAYTADWTQPLALFASGTFAFLSPWHFLAFAVPNVFALALTMIIGPALHNAKGDGYTLPEVFGHVSRGVSGGLLRTVFAIFAIISLAYTMALNLTMLQAANQETLRLWIGEHLGVSMLTLSILAGVIAYLWATPHGMRGTMIGDIGKIFFIFLGAAGIALLWIFPVAPFDFAIPLPDLSPMNVFWVFGVPFAVSLIGGAISKPEMVERNYAIEKSRLVLSGTVSVVLFSIILVAYGSLGFLARMLGMGLMKDQLPALEIVKFLPAAEPLVILIVTVVLISSLASQLASAGTVWGTEIVKRFGLGSSEEETIAWSRAFMFITLIGGFVMALRVNDIAVLLQNMSIVRGEQIVAIFVVLLWPRAVSPWVVLIGVVGGAIAGPYFTFVEHNPPLGAIVAFSVPLVFCVLGAVWRWYHPCSERDVILK